MACRKPIPFDGLVFCDGNTMSFDVTVFLGVYDEFSGISAGRIALAGTTAISVLHQGAFGDRWQLAVALLTAHRLALAYNISAQAESLGKNDQSSTNETTSISASTSSLSEGFSQLNLANEDDPFTTDLARTGYGLELLGLIRTLIPAGEIIHGAPLPAAECGPLACRCGVLAMKVVARVRSRLANLKNLEATYKKLVAEARVECAVGYPAGSSGLGTPEPAHDDRASVIQVALWNNFGTEHAPARPFMDLAAREMRDVYKKGMEALGPKIARGAARVDKVLDVLGLQAEECVRRAIMDGEWAPNAPETVKRKGSSRPLVDTATMRNRVTHVVRQKSS